MDNLDAQVAGLESLEKRRVIEWQRVYQQRKVEDDIILKNRNDEDTLRADIHAAEDARWVECFAGLDDDLDGLRKRKRQIERAPLPSASHNSLTPIPNQDHRLGRPPKPSCRKYLKRSNNHGEPTAFDSNGKPPYTRLSDGMLVYLNCPLDGCNKTSFKTVHALMCHVSDHRGHNKKKVFHSQKHAIELCGRIAPGQGSQRPESALDSKEDIGFNNINMDNLGVLPSIEKLAADELGGIVEDGVEYMISRGPSPHVSFLDPPVDPTEEWMETYVGNDLGASQAGDVVGPQQTNQTRDVSAETQDDLKAVDVESDSTEEIHAAENSKPKKIVLDLSR